MKGQSAVSVAKSKRDLHSSHMHMHSLILSHVDRCFNIDIMGSHFLHSAKQGWKGLPQYPLRAFQNSIYVIIGDRVANRNNLPPGFHCSVAHSL